MSSTDGDKESPLASTRVKDKPAKLREYRFQLVKRVVDAMFPAKSLKLEAGPAGASPERR
jgi:hypothetical protein